MKIFNKIDILCVIHSIFIPIVFTEFINHFMDNSVKDIFSSKDKILECVKTFTTELSISFDYITNSTELEQFYTNLTKDDILFSNFVKKTIEHLKPYEMCITNIVLTNRKIKTSEYTFLTNLKLFDDLLDFSLFSHENKNTKKMLIKYLYNLYFSCFLHDLSHFDSNNLEEHLQQFMNSMTSVKSSEQTPSSSKNSSSSRNRTRQSNQSNTGLENIMETMFSNPDLFNIANELTTDLKSQNVNPMSLIQGLMSGNMDGKVGDLIQNMTQKLETKIANGEIDTKQLEEQTQHMMSQLPIGDLVKNLGSGLGNLGKF